MKRTVTMFFSMLILLAVLIPGTVAQAANSTNASKVFQYLTEELGFNAAASCGIMANIEHESEFKPNLVIRDRNGLLSGGLCQWNGGRFTNLRNFCNNKGYDYLSITGQLEYLNHELQKDSYRHIYKYMKNVPDSGDGAYNAAYYWCYYFEVPYNRAAKATSRANAALGRYWPVYRFKAIGSVNPTSKQENKTLDLDDAVTVSWKAVKGSVTGYRVSVAEKKNGAFDWNTAKQIALSSAENKIKLDLNELNPGRYAVRVVGTNQGANAEGKCKHTIKFDVSCLSHDFALSREIVPTFEKSGKQVSVCQKCGEKKVVKQQKLTEAFFAEQVVPAFKTMQKTPTSVTLSWNSLPVAQGYRIWQKVNGDWIKIKTLSQKHTSFTVTDLKSASRYGFKIAAYAQNGEELVLSAADALAVFTQPKQVKLKETVAKNGGKVVLRWNRVKGADGYCIYTGDDPAADPQAVLETGALRQSCTVRDLDAGTRVFFSVRAFVNTENGRVYSDPSNVRHATVK